MENGLRASEIMYQYLDPDTRTEYFFTEEEMKMLNTEVERIKREIKQYEVKHHSTKM